MKRRFFDIYQYIALFVLCPFSYFLWKSALHSNKLTIIILGLPILVSYIIPLIGTNITKFWEFNIKNKTLNIRPHHGFVFGSTTSLIGFIFYLISPAYTGILNSLIFAVVCGAFIAFWNTLYDYNAVKCGLIKINNISAKKGKSSLEIVWDYAPVYFYTLGFIYALFIKLMEHIKNIGLETFSIKLILLFYMLALTLPTIMYMLFHYKKYKNWEFGGCK